MPGIIVFKRRWGVGSDDLVVPGAFLFTVHLIWLIILLCLLTLVHFDKASQCVLLLWCLALGYTVILAFSMIMELWICVVAMRGSILDTSPRASMQHLLYVKVALMVVEGGWLTAGVVWFAKYYFECRAPDRAKDTLLGMVVFNWCILISILLTVWCTYDAAGRSWVKMKQYQRSMRESETKFQYKRSGSTRNWRQRKVIRAYQDSWHQRCRYLFCCLTSSDRNQHSFAEIARLLSDFFRDLDVVPSDVIAGLVLLRKFQQIERRAIVEQRRNDTYEFLSGAAITPRTKFLALQADEDGPTADLHLFRDVIHYAHFALAAYGWPLYVWSSPVGLCKLCSLLRWGRCCRCFCCANKASSRSDDTRVGVEGEDGSKINHAPSRTSIEIVEDNCCDCNAATLDQLRDLGDIEVIYATYHVDVGETPFYVALDYDRRKIVISVRGTLSMNDILTDLNAEGEPIPLDPPPPGDDEWLAHKGMVQAAKYIYDKLRTERLIERAQNHAVERGTHDFGLVIVGHSLGAGTASILGILLRNLPQYAALVCFTYAPPGGLLSLPAVEYTKSFIVSVVVGKDVVPRLGLHQMEALRSDLINAIKRSVDPKWKTISCSILCCGCSHQPTSAVELSSGESSVGEYMRSRETARYESQHPSDHTISLSSHQPLYPPGRIIHVVRNHQKRGENTFSKRQPVYQALWAQTLDFEEVLISPVMIQDHMPDTVLEALNKVIKTLGPRKPRRTRHPPLSHLPPPPPPLTTTLKIHDTRHQRLHFETSFASPPSISMNQPPPPPPPHTTLESPLNRYYSILPPNRYDSPHQQYTTNMDEFFNRYSHNLGIRNLAGSHNNNNNNGGWYEGGGGVGVNSEAVVRGGVGVAPLAAPESLSDVSSVCSSTQCHVVMRTPPIMMRRTPQMIGSLSTCADDVRNLLSFRRSQSVGQKNGNSFQGSGRSSLSSINVCGGGGCGEGAGNTSGDYISKDDPDTISNLAIDLNLDVEHRSTLQIRPAAFIVATPQPSLSDDRASSISSSTTVCCTGYASSTNNTITKNVSFNPHIISIVEDNDAEEVLGGVKKKRNEINWWRFRNPQYTATKKNTPKDNCSTRTMVTEKKSDNVNYDVNKETAMTSPYGGGGVKPVKVYPESLKVQKSAVTYGGGGNTSNESQV